MAITELPPRGHYLAREAGRLAGVSGRTIGQWARRGYIRSSQSVGPPRIYSYQDVAEAMVVHALLGAHVDHRAIKQAIESLRTEKGTDWPLSHARLQVPLDHPLHDEMGKRKRTVVVRDEARNVEVDTATGHPVLRDIDLMLIATDLRRGGWAARDLTDIRHIEVDPDRLSGRPAIAGRRVPAEDVARLATRPEGRQILREEYDLHDDEIEDAERWWQAVARYEQAA